MSLSFCSFSSGSSGNCYLIKSENTALLVDAGISLKKIIEGLDLTETPIEMLSAVLITHEHIDHVRSLKAISNKHKTTIYANKGTFLGNNINMKDEFKSEFQTGDRFIIGDIEVKSFNIYHDASEPVGFSFFNEGKQISIVTDTGKICNQILDEISDADLLVLEANHDVDMLRIGRYPWFLKQRVLSEVGHLSNESCGEAILSLIEKKEKHRNVLLAHLSKENNFPEMAYQTVKNILEEKSYYIGKNVDINLILRDEPSKVFVL
jgi:phosphoribosyl 1,2-cyclic phosphodiesterase